MRAHVLVCRGPDCASRGAQDVYTAVAWEVERRGLSEEVVQTQCGCVGPLCGERPGRLLLPDRRLVRAGGAGRRGRDRGARPGGRRGRARPGCRAGGGGGVNHTEAFDEVLGRAALRLVLLRGLRHPRRPAAAQRGPRRAGARQRPPGAGRRPTTTSRSPSRTRTATARAPGVVWSALTHPRRPPDRRPHLGRRDPHPGAARAAPPLRPLASRRGGEHVPGRGRPAAPRRARGRPRPDRHRRRALPGPLPGPPRAGRPPGPEPGHRPGRAPRRRPGRGRDALRAPGRGRAWPRRGPTAWRPPRRASRRPRPSRSAPTRRCSPT